MAVYEHLYGAYEGESQSAWSRFLVIPRYAVREVFKSKLLSTEGTGTRGFQGESF